ncbi:MAG: NAD(P)H-binding protein [Homoserinimonas sp.]
MAAPILVTGGTGTLGRLVVSRLQKAGRDVRVLSRSAQQNAGGVEYVVGDVSTGEGLDRALQGAETVIHCAGSGKGDDDKARHLVRAASKAGVQHLVFISVVGADRIPVTSGLDRTMFGYFDAKREAEQIVADSGLPYTTLRATQFHDLNLLAVQQVAKMPVAPAPAGFRFQPIDADEVAERLVELALGEPAGLVPDMGGPRVYSMTDLIRSYLRVVRRRRPIMQLRMPGKAARAFREGANLAPERKVGRKTWEEFLGERVG